MEMALALFTLAMGLPAFALGLYMAVSAHLEWRAFQRREREKTGNGNPPGL